MNTHQIVTIHPDGRFTTTRAMPEWSAHALLATKRRTQPLTASYVRAGTVRRYRAPMELIGA